MSPRVRFAVGLTVLTALLGAAGTVFLVGPLSAAQPAAPGASFPADATGWGWFSAALATGLSALGAGIAVGKLGTAAVGALAEKPELFGRLLIFIGLAEGIAIYGLIVSILILNRLG